MFNILKNPLVLGILLYFSLKENRKIENINRLTVINKAIQLLCPP